MDDPMTDVECYNGRGRDCRLNAWQKRRKTNRRTDRQTKWRLYTEDKYDTDWWFAAMYNMKEEKIDAVQVKQFRDDLPVCCFQSLIELLSEVNETWRSGFKKGVGLLNFNSVCLCLSLVPLFPTLSLSTNSCANYYLSYNKYIYPSTTSINPSLLATRHSLFHFCVSAPLIILPYVSLTIKRKY